MTVECASCGAPITWAITPAGKRMPVDAEPTPNGNVELTHLGPVTRATVHEVGLAGVVIELYQLLADTAAQRDHWRGEYDRVADLLVRYTEAGSENPVRVAFVLEATEAVLADVTSMLAAVLEAAGDAVPDALRDEVAHVVATGRRWRDGEGVT